jgi:hypothetical protein
MLGFPATAANVPVSVVLSPHDGGETWTRTFGRTSFTSVQRRGRGRNDALMLERFGIVTVALALVIDEDRLFLVPRSWSALGIPLPRSLLPTGRSFETERAGRFCFDVEIAVPGLGLIVAYNGSLEPVRVSEAL